MSFDILHTIRTGIAIVVAVLFVVTLSACQVQPLYAETSGVSSHLAEIGFSDPRSRVGQEVRNHLIFLTSGGSGEALSPRYNVQLAVSSVYNDILDDEDAKGLQPGRVIVTGTYSLSRISDGEHLKSGSRRATSLLDVSRQEFAEIRSVRDAENRAARELAEFIRADLARALANEPSPQPSWQK